jgi:glycosyltransferase involved in cell wall biosynthesis
MHSLEKRGRWDLLRPMINLVRLVRDTKPAVMYGYLPSENLVAVITRIFNPSIKVVWGIQASNMDLSRYDWFTRSIYKLQAYLAPCADLVIANSHAGRDYYIAQGFPERKIKIIHNPIDGDRFKPDKQAGKKVRSEWGVQADEKLIGLVGRLDPMKDHPTFLKAAALLAQERKEVRFVCIGDGPAKYRDQLHALGVEVGLVDRLIWANAREEITSVYNALDVAVSSSAYGEGCSNVICEAMACGVPCVVTDVGDSAQIVGEFGVVVAVGDPDLLARGISPVLATPSRTQSERIRERILTNFSAASCITLTDQALESMFS